VEENSKTCIVCDKMYIPKDYPNHVFKRDPNKDKKCSSCWGRGKFNCADCGTSYIGQYDGYSFYKPSNSRCKTCSNVRLKILNDGNPPSECIKDGFKIQITYDVHRQTHDGYCSDPYDMVSEDDEERVELPVWKGVTNADIDRDGAVISNLHGYYDRDEGGCGGGGGSGYCGCTTTYIIKDAKVIKDDRLIDLGD